jgi:hypothetical protein
MEDFLNKFKKRMVLENNKLAGRMAEASFDMSMAAQGKQVERKHVGHDRVVRTIDPWTGRVTKTERWEIKSSQSAPLSEKQERMKKKYKNYRVYRPSGFL